MILFNIELLLTPFWCD